MEFSARLLYTILTRSGYLIDVEHQSQDIVQEP